MRNRLTRHDRFARRQSGRGVQRTAAAVLLCTWLLASPARAADGTSLEPAAVSPTAPAAAQPAPAPAPGPTEPVLPAAALPTATPGSPALDLTTPPPAPDKPSILHRWWFWTAVGAAAAATVVIIVVSSRGHAPPATDLGNQEFQP